MIRHLPEQSDRPVSYSVGSESEPVKLPYADATFDAVFSVGVLEHVREVGGDELESLREIGRVLRPDGLFFCFHLPNRLSWIEALTSVFRGRYHHKYKYTKADILALMETSGFKIEHLRRCNAFPRNIFSSLSFLHRSRWLARLVDGLDGILGVVLNPFCQNYVVIARRLER